MKRAYARVAPPGSTQPRTVDELLERVVVTPDGCWIYTGGGDGYGDEYGRGEYGRILRPGTRRVMPMHKYVVVYVMGIEVPDGWHVDHLCSAWNQHDPKLVYRCCNPDHLEPVPGVVNQQRKLLRRLGYIDEDCADYGPNWLVKADQEPILAPGETDEDLYL
jgi:hypothetical protein